MNQAQDIPGASTPPTAAPGARLPVATGGQSWRTVWQVSRGHRLKFLAVVIIGISSAAAGLVGPAAVGHLVDRVQEGAATTTTVLWILLIMSAAAVLGAMGTAVTVVLASRSYHAILAELRESLVMQAMTLPQAVVENAGTGDLVSRGSDDVAQIADAAPKIIPAFTMTGFTIAVTLAGMAALDLWYGVALMVVLPVHILTMRWYLRTAPRIYQRERAAMSNRAQELIESQRGYDTIAGFNLGQLRHETVLAASWKVVRHTLRTRTVQNMFFGRLHIGEFSGMASILIVGFWLIGSGDSTVGGATTAVLLFLRLFGPINQLLLVVDTLQSALASLNRIVGVILAGTPAATPPGTIPVSPASPASVSPETAPAAPPRDVVVRVDGVSFSYDGAHPVLHHVNLEILRGQRVAVVGASGAGKTTLATVIAGIHPPDDGQITRPEKTAVITQEVHVFTGTLRDNLTLALPQATDQQITAALETTDSMSLVDLLPQGLDTPIGSGGRELTPAQAQLLALARLVLANPEVAILDEATAEAGSTHAEQLEASALGALAGRTGLVIAHRLTQAATSDTIVVMEQGRIVEQGSHTALLRRGGVYAALWQTWSSARADQV